MKVTFNIDCTPQEARAFFGLPDVAPMQEKLMSQMQDKMTENIKNMDPETLAKTWIPLAMQNWTEMQKTFWGQLGQMNPMAAAASAGKESDSAKKK
ncbi:MAG: DUF6489 family protein [Pseudobdellovibrionaceae bacterium]